MAIFTVATLALATLAGNALAQGDPEAASGLSFNEPTKSWEQWQPKPTYALDKLPDQYMGANRIPVPGGGEPQTGYNRCVQDKWNQDSKCQTAFINDEKDWCIWGPPDGGDIGSTERVAVAYCTTPKHGTRLIPDGTLKSVHFLKTPNYVQVAGRGDFTSIGIPQGDDGGEMDPHGADDLGNPIGGVMFTTANPVSNGEPWMVREWTNFMSWDQYCLRACWGDQAAARCEHIYDVLGCRWNMPSATAYQDEAVFETCDGDNAPLQGIFDGSTFRQGDASTPDAHPPASSSNCKAESSISHGLLAANFAATSNTAPTSGLATVTQNGSARPTGTAANNQNNASSGSSSSGSGSESGSSGAASLNTVTAFVSTLSIGGLAMLCYLL